MLPSDPSSPTPSGPVRTLDDFLARELPRLSKRERRRLAARGGITINGREVTDVGAPLGEADRVALPPPPGGSKWTAPEPPPPQSPRPEPEARGASPAAPGRAPRSKPVPRAVTVPAPRPAPAAPAPARAVPRDADPVWGEQPTRQPHLEGRMRQGVADPRAKRYLARGVRLVYEDDDVLVVDKSTGIVTADPTHKLMDTVFEVIKKYMRRAGRVSGRGADRKGRVWVIHRLDKEASGLLVFAKTEAAFDAIKEQFRSKRTDRVYYTVVQGVVGAPGHAGTHQSFLVDAGEHDPRMKSFAAGSFRGAPGKEGRLAVTHYRVVVSNPDVLAGTGATLLQVRLETGRKNQIRAHMADIGHPIVGDQRYGAITDPLGRVALHAAELGFTHPRTGRPIRFTSPAPGPFYRCVGAKPPAGQGDDEGDAEAVGAAVAPVSRGAPPVPRAGGVPDFDTSWDRVAQWYDDLISEKRNDHYEDVILPGTLRLIGPEEGMRVLDLACGQGVLTRRLATLGVQVTGVDAAPQLIGAARARAVEKGAVPPTYLVADARELPSLHLSGFDAAACVMALGNIEPLAPVFRGVAAALREHGSFTFIVAHPAFRAPGQTAWGWDEGAKKQYRRVEGYLSAGQHAIQMHPGKDASVVTWTFHRPLQAYAKALADAGFVIEMIEEWTGKRTSNSGPRAAEENRSRREIPLFLAVRAVKKTSK